MMCRHDYASSNRVRWLFCFALVVQGIFLIKHVPSVKYSTKLVEAFIAQTPTETNSHRDMMATSSNVGDNSSQNQDIIPSMQLDLLVPISNRDDRLRIFARQLGSAIQKYQQEQEPSTNSTEIRNDSHIISKFRLLVTRFSEEDQSDKLRDELSALTHVPSHQILLVHSPAKFSRGRAAELLHTHCCREVNTCIVSLMDVDMEVRSVFFHHAIEALVLNRKHPERELKALQEEISKQKQEQQAILLAKAKGNTSISTRQTKPAYFPIVWTAYNPKAVTLVEAHWKQEMNKTLPEFSEHRGQWRQSGKGMYVIWGSDAPEYHFNLSLEGWGGEDVDFFKKVLARSSNVIRWLEPGLIHVWHAKDCFDNAGMTDSQVGKCKASVKSQEGSRLGLRLLDKERERRNSTSIVALLQR